MRWARPIPARWIEAPLTNCEPFLRQEPRVVLSLFKGLITVQPAPVFIGEVATVVARTYGLAARDLCGHHRATTHSWARFEFMWVAHRLRGLSLAHIAAWLGLEDHTSVLYGVRRHERRLFAIALKEALG